jgi:hypothetical protein
MGRIVLHAIELRKTIIRGWWYAHCPMSLIQAMKSPDAIERSGTST